MENEQNNTDKQKSLEEVKAEKDAVKDSENKNQKKEMCYCHKGKFWLIGVLVFVVIVFLALAAVSVARLNHSKFHTQRNFMKMGRNYNRMRGSRGKGYINNQNVAQGKVTAVNDKVFTMDLNGQSKNVQISDSTRFPLNSATTVNTGDTVLVWGGQDSNGTIQATQILVNPQNQQ